MKRRQTGVSLSGLLISAVVLAVAALLVMKIAPEVIEYLQIVRAVKKVAQDPSASASVSEARKSFDQQATVDNISAIAGQDLHITKEGERVVISFAYERRVHLFGNVSLLLEFQGSSQD